MKNKFDIVSGDFEGNFYTHQKTILTNSEFNSDEKKHDIYLYRGELSKVKEEKEYNPEQFRNRDSFLLHNVSNVQFHLERDAAGNNTNGIYTFEQLLLRDAVIKESWELNGKTYGIISGKLLGKVKGEVKTADPSNPQEPIKPTTPNQPKPKPTNPDSTGDVTGNEKPNRFWKNWSNPTNPINPTSPNGGCLNVGNGCLTFGSGCLNNIWKLLLSLLLLLFILWFLKGCWEKREESKNCCKEIDSLDIVNKKNQNILDSLNEEITKRENLLKECQDEQKKNQELEERRRRRNGRVGEVTVTLIWDSEDDLDLSVTEPTSEKIWYNKPKAPSGGYLDIDANREKPFYNNPVENIFWLKNAPEGNYYVNVKLYTKRTDLDEIPFYIEIKTGENIESYEGILMTNGDVINYNFNYSNLNENP